MNRQRSRVTFAEEHSVVMALGRGGVVTLPRRVLFGVILLGGLVFITALVWLNFRIYCLPAGAATQGQWAEDGVLQLNNIGRRLRLGEGTAMQALFPEGWFFSHAVYGYAWVNVGLQTPEDSLKERAIDEVRWVLERIESAEGVAPFLDDTQVEHGVFYLGWKNRLLGGLLALGPTDAQMDVDLFHHQCQQLAIAFQRSPTRHLDAYPGHAWPCDNVMALASLRLHDHLFEPKFGGVIHDWLTFTRDHLDPATGLIVHKIDGHSGSMLIPARASSQVYIHAVLPELDPTFAREQYERFRALFVEDWYGYLPVCEYPKGKVGEGDVDTGPLILGISPSATVVSIAAARANGDFELAERSVILSETIGVPWTTENEKSFWFGRMIVADAFLVWGKSLVSWVESAPEPYPGSTPDWWRLRLHGVSLLATCLILLAGRIIKRLIRYL